MKNKILFGTDWYMTLIALDGTTYRTFCNNFWNFFMDDKFEQGQELWQRFTFINPFKFYGFNNMATIDNIANALLNKGANPELIDINRKKFQGLIKDFDKICDKIEKGLQ